MFVFMPTVPFCWPVSIPETPQAKPPSFKPKLGGSRKRDELTAIKTDRERLALPALGLDIQN